MTDHLEVIDLDHPKEVLMNDDILTGINKNREGIDGRRSSENRPVSVLSNPGFDPHAPIESKGPTNMERKVRLDVEESDAWTDQTEGSGSQSCTSTIENDLEDDDEDEDDDEYGNLPTELEKKDLLDVMVDTFGFDRMFAKKIDDEAFSTDESSDESDDVSSCADESLSDESQGTHEQTVSPSDCNTNPNEVELKEVNRLCTSDANVTNAIMTKVVTGPPSDHECDATLGGFDPSKETAAESDAGNTRTTVVADIPGKDETIPPCPEQEIDYVIKRIQCRIIKTNVLNQLCRMEDQGKNGRPDRAGGAGARKKQTGTPGDDKSDAGTIQKDADGSQFDGSMADDEIEDFVEDDVGFYEQENPFYYDEEQDDDLLDAMVDAFWLDRLSSVLTLRIESAIYTGFFPCIA